MESGKIFIRIEKKYIPEKGFLNRYFIGSEEASRASSLENS